MSAPRVLCLDVGSLACLAMGARGDRVKCGCCGRWVAVETRADGVRLVGKHGRRVRSDDPAEIVEAGR